MLINIAELLPLANKEEIFDVFKTPYQQKVGLFLFAAIAIKPDIAPAIFKFLKFN